MAEAFVKTFKRDYVSVNPVPDAQTAIDKLPIWFEHYNSFHPHKALGYRSLKELLADKKRQSSFIGSI
jgi:putative transposase